MRRWLSVTIRSNKQAATMAALFQEQNPSIGAFDTETNGLHIIHSKPFMFQFGWLDPEKPIGYTFAVDLIKQPGLANQVIKAWHVLAKTLKKYLAHNVKFDLHMLTNNGTPYLEDNLSDTTYYIRAAHDALTVDNGGPPMGLKDYASRYIDRSAKDHEKLLMVEKSTIAKALNQRLRERMLACGRPPAQYKAASYTLAVLKDIFKDPISDWKDLPTEETRMAYDDWLHLDVPAEIRDKVTGLVEPDMIPYSWLNRENLTTYAHGDIIWVLEIYEQTVPVITARDNWKIVEVEDSLVLPLYEMERVGFAVDVDYINTSKVRTKAYIQKQRQELYDLAGEVFSISQHAKIKIILQNYGVDIDTTNDETLSRCKNDLIHDDPENKAIQIIEHVQELRTLEKWYSTYILRFMRDLKNTDHIYTTINSVGTVSGRVTSDFQQFPKAGLRTKQGEELFWPRRMVKPSGGKYKAIVYLDYSQIELRFQALYTILVGHPDLNLCRAYMPYKCVNSEGVLFDCNNPEHIKSWNAPWFYEEEPTKRWVATDVHGATTKAAFGIDETDPRYHDLRYIGKRVNFAKNYGAQFQKIWSMFPEYDEEQAYKIDDAYYKAFPGVKAYHNYCYERADYYSHTQNLFGVRYYGLSGHKLINCLVQGSAAYYLKWKIRQLYDYSKEHNLKTRWQMQIHDELSWEWNCDDPPEIFFEYKRIMEDWPDASIPVVADMEATTTTWAEKKEMGTIDELKDYFSA